MDILNQKPVEFEGERKTDVRDQAPMPKPADILDETEATISGRVDDLHLGQDRNPPENAEVWYRMLETREEQGVTIVRITERKLEGAAMSCNFGEDLTALAGQCIADIVVDFSAVEYLASSFLNKLIILARKVKAYGGTLKLAGMQPDIREVFVITRLNQFFDICDSVGGALAGYREEQQRRQGAVAAVTRGI